MIECRDVEGLFNLAVIGRNYNSTNSPNFLALIRVIYLGTDNYHSFRSGSTFRGIHGSWSRASMIGGLQSKSRKIQRSIRLRTLYPIVRDELENEAQKKLKVPVMDNDTRQGSVMDMIEYPLENWVHLDMYCRNENDLQLDQLIEQDWIDLKTVHCYKFNLTR